MGSLKLLKDKNSKKESFKEIFLRLEKIENIIKEIVTKHNTLAKDVEQSKFGIAGSLDSLFQNIEKISSNLGALQNQDKTLIFHTNKIQAEILAMREYLQEKGIDFTNFKQKADEVFKVDLGIDSDYIPVGMCITTYYN